MSLFEDDKYQFCDTFFIFFDIEKHPTLDDVVSALSKGSERYELSAMRAQDGKFNAITVRCPHDRSAMDITVVVGDEVQEQIQELVSEFRTMSLDGEDYKKLMKIEKATGRLDVYHFERVSDSSDEDMLDPGGLFLVIDKLNAICDGIGHDPQSKTLI